MFSRSVPPTHCVKGNDSMGKHVSRELIASSARRGVMSVPACIIFQRTRRREFAALKLLGFLTLRLERLQLFVETPDVGLQFVYGGVVFLHQHFLLFVGLLLLVRRQFLRILRRGVLH